MSAIEEVGVRVVLLGQKQAAAAAAQMRADLKALAADTKTQSAAIAAAQRDVAAAQTKAAAASKAYADARVDLAAKNTAASEALATGDAKATAAAKAEADAQKTLTKSLMDQKIAAASQASAARANLSAVTATAAAADESAAAHGRLTKGLTALASVGKYAFAGVAAGATYLAVTGVKSIATFNDQMTRLGTLANVPTSTLPELSKWAINNSPRLLESVSTIADQMYRIASANSGLNLTTKQLEDMTVAAAHLSVLGGPMTDPEQTARVFGILTANGGLGLGKNYQAMGATAAATVGAGDMQMNDLIQALGSGGLAPAAAHFGVNFGQLGAVLADLGDLGVTGSQAGHSLAHALSLIGTPSKQAAGVYASIGLTPTQLDLAMKTSGITGAAQMLMAHLNAATAHTTATPAQLVAQGFTQQQAQQLIATGGPQAAQRDLLLTRMFGGAKQSIPIISVLDTLTRVNGKQQEINKTTADYGAKVSQQYNTAASTFKRWDLDLKQLGNRIGVFLIPKIIALGNWISKHQALVKTLAGIIGGVLLVVMAAWIVSLGIAAVEMIAATWPILAIVAAVTGLAVGIVELYRHWDQIWSWMADHKQYAAVILLIGMVMLPFITWPIILAGVATHWASFWQSLQQYAATGVNDIINIINDFTGAINSALGWAGVHIPKIGLVDWGANHPPAMTSADTKLMAAAKTPRLATGGLIANHPIAIVGEGNPAHDEYVIPTDPAYRARALGLYAALGTKLMASGGGIWGDLTGAAKSVVDPFGIAGKTLGAIQGVAGDVVSAALSPLERTALSAANMLPAGMIRQVADGLITQLFTWASHMGSASGSSGGTGSAAPAGQVRSWIDAALKLMGQPLSFEGGLYRMIMAESGGNPFAINRWDSNAKAGHPSQGLLQTIPGTFAEYVWPSLRGSPITDPVANITAGFRYAMANYGAAMIMDGGRHNSSGAYIGYATGGLLPVRSYDVGGLLPTGTSIAVNGTGSPEPVGGALGGVNVTVNVNGSVVGSRRALLAEVKAAVSEAVARR